MTSKHHTAILISDFTIDNLAGYIENDSALPQVRTVVAPFGQVIQVLTNEQAECWQTEPDVAVVWTRPESAIRSFNRVLQFESVDLNEIFQEVDAYCAALCNVRSRVKLIFIPTWVLPRSHPGLGAFDLRLSGITYALMQMNARLIQNLADSPNCIVLDTQRWLSKVGQTAFNTKLWYMAKIPFSNDVFKEAVRHIKSAIRASNGHTKKLIILDLDETLWSGTVGDVGWENLVLGGHDPTGEALVDFQKQLKALKNRGILLAVVSKNEESVALETIRKHPEMVLREDDLAAWRINWRDKAENVLAIVNELSIGLDSAVFIDDNPMERARVKESLPAVTVPDWPQDKLLYSQALFALDCFDSPIISNEDRQRVGMYASERQRLSLKTAVASMDEWLKTLAIRVRVEPINTENLVRVAQLFNKTNQMNLSTRRMTGSELLDWASKHGRQMFAFRVSDRFGDSGLTGILSTEIQGQQVQIVDFILSCRVMGRNIEETLIAFAVECGRSQGLKRLWLQYAATGKNKPCLDFLLRSELTQTESTVFSWKLSEPYPIPEHIKFERTLMSRAEERFGNMIA
jgi:FkbH-like protein